jgi:hypothetical protein
MPEITEVDLHKIMESVETGLNLVEKLAAENAELREQLKKPEPEMHPVVDLFLKRAASNPEEMANGRWKWVLERIQMHGSQSEKDAVQPVFNKLRLDGAHKEMMGALLNPEPDQLGLFSNTQLKAQAQAHNQAQHEALTRAQNALTNNIPYKKLGQP